MAKTEHQYLENIQRMFDDPDFAEMCSRVKFEIFLRGGYASTSFKGKGGRMLGSNTKKQSGSGMIRRLVR